VDSLVAPDCGVADGSAARVVLPGFGPAYSERLGIDRLQALDIMVSRDHAGTPRIVLSVEAAQGGASILVTLDRSLRPLAVERSDELTRMARAWPGPLRDEFLSEDYWARWLARHHRFEPAA
jgi:hypothetical protein